LNTFLVNKIADTSLSFIILILAATIFLLDKPKKGLRGPQGPNGSRGFASYESLEGSTGERGHFGLRGNQGQIGPQGNRGANGNTGHIGPSEAGPIWPFFGSLFCSSFDNSGSSYVQMLESTDDGLTWHHFETPGLNLRNITSIKSNGNHWVACGSTLDGDPLGCLVYYSTNFIEWMPIKRPPLADAYEFGVDLFGNRTANTVCFGRDSTGAGMWIVGGVDVTLYAFSAEANWYKVLTTETYNSIKYLDYGPAPGFYAVGSVLSYMQFVPTTGPFEGKDIFSLISLSYFDTATELADIEIFEGQLFLVGASSTTSGVAWYLEYPNDIETSWTIAQTFIRPCTCLSTNAEILVLGMLGYTEWPADGRPQLFYSTDGIQWTQTVSNLSVELASITNVYWTGTTFIATAFWFNENPFNAIFTSVDGQAWSHDLNIYGGGPLSFTGLPPSSETSLSNYKAGRLGISGYNIFNKKPREKRPADMLAYTSIRKGLGDIIYFET